MHINWNEVYVWLYEVDDDNDQTDEIVVFEQYALRDDDIDEVKQENHDDGDEAEVDELDEVLIDMHIIILIEKIDDTVVARHEHEVDDTDQSDEIEWLIKHEHDEIDIYLVLVELTIGIEVDEVEDDALMLIHEQLDEIELEIDDGIIEHDAHELMLQIIDEVEVELVDVIAHDDLENHEYLYWDIQQLVDIILHDEQNILVEIILFIALHLIERFHLINKKRGNRLFFIYVRKL